MTTVSISLLSGRHISTVRISCQVFLYRWWNESKQQYLLVSLFVLTRYTLSGKVSCWNLNTNQHLLPVCGSWALEGVWTADGPPGNRSFLQMYRGRFGPEPRCFWRVLNHKKPKRRRGTFRSRWNHRHPSPFLPSFLPFLPFLSFLSPSVAVLSSSSSSGVMTAGGEQVGSERCGRTDLRGRLHVRTVSAPPAFKDTAAAAAAAAVSLPVPFKLKQTSGTETRRRSALP